LVQASEAAQLWPVIYGTDEGVHIGLALPADSAERAEWLAMKALHRSLGLPVTVVSSEPTEI
jgi:hypothetical protein